jgi:anthranilate synthase component 1
VATTISRRRYAGQVDLLGLSWLNPARYPFLLQSAASGPELARYDILFAFPGETLTLAAGGSLTGPAGAGQNGFLGALDEWWSRECEDADAAAATLPFRGGWFVYLGYELAGEIETGLRLETDDSLPLAFATRIPVAVIHDRQRGTTDIVGEGDCDEAIAKICADLDRIAAMPTFIPTPAPVYAVREEPPEQFLSAVARAKEYISAGDIFQANLSRRWRAKLKQQVDPCDLYARLRETNPAPFAGLVLRDDFVLISSSPERLIRRDGQQIDTRPIAGTRPRNDSRDDADATRAELLASQKDRAEHVMLIDLERNDLGRVCEGGSVHVSEFMVVESYSHVHHIVSNVRGQARAGLTPGELIRAVFPGGTITGCPKVRCMEIIAELERRARGPYTGSMGYLNRNGDCDFNILIRTMLVRDERIEVDAGSGIVADSDPVAELDETRAKAKGLLLALQDN